jgi:hypothetical protein
VLWVGSALPVRSGSVSRIQKYHLLLRQEPLNILSKFTQLFK